MNLGAILPQTEIGADPEALREYAQAVEELGYSHLLAYDHVVGANPAHYPGWVGAYDYKDMFHEPFVLFGYLAAVTRVLELVPCVMILPQRHQNLIPPCH